MRNLVAGTSVLYFFNSFEVVGNAALTSLDSKGGPGLWGSQGVFHTSTKSKFRNSSLRPFILKTQQECSVGDVENPESPEGFPSWC
jgi:hypothetical protein